VLLLEVLEKPWNLILDFKGAWKALEKKNFCWKCWKIMKTPWIFVRMGKNIGLYCRHWTFHLWLSLKIHFISGGAFLKLLLTNENISKHSARQSKLALNTPWKHVLHFGAWILLEFYVQKPAQTMYTYPVILKKKLKDPGLIAGSLFSDIAKFYCALFTPYHVNNKDLDLAACCILANFQSWWQKIMACICGLIFMLIIMFLPSPSDWLADFYEGVRDQWKKKHLLEWSLTHLT